MCSFCSEVLCSHWMHFTGPDLLLERGFSLFWNSHPPSLGKDGQRDSTRVKGPKVFSSKVLKGLDYKFPVDFVKNHSSKFLPVPPMATFPAFSILLGPSFIFFICGFNLAVLVARREMTFLMMLCSKCTRPALFLIVSPSSRSCSSCPDSQSRAKKSGEPSPPSSSLWLWGCTCPAFSLCHKSGWEFALKITLKTIWDLTYLWDGDCVTPGGEGVHLHHIFSVGNQHGFSFPVMDGIKQARSLILLIYWSPELTYFFLLVLWCGAREAVNNALPFPGVWKHRPQGFSL